MVLVVHLPSIVGSIDQGADAVAPGEIARLFSAHSGTVVPGDEPLYATLLFELGTRWLTFYRALWGLAPFLTSGLSFAAVAWSVWRVAGGWAASITLSLLVCASAPMLTQLGMLDGHTLTWFSDSVLISGLVWVLSAGRSLRRSRWVPASVALGLLLAVNLASDQLLFFGGILPLLGGALWAHRRSQSARSAEGVRYALLVSAVTIVGSIVVGWQMREHHIVANPGWKVGVAALGTLPSHLALWVRSLAFLGGYYTVSPRTPLASVFEISAGVLLLAAVALLPWVAFRTATTAASKRVTAETSAARDAFVAAWGLSALLVSTVFVLSNAVIGLATTRYVIGVPIAAAALAPLAVSRRSAVVAMVAAASIYGIGGMLSIADGEASHGPVAVTRSQVNTFVRLARAEHVMRGYTSYWDAAPLTWETHFRLLAFPAGPCDTGFCHTDVGYDSAWYTPHRGVHTFLITDNAKGGMPFRPSSLGPPLATFHVGREFTFLVYGYDIASRITRP